MRTPQVPYFINYRCLVVEGPRILKYKMLLYFYINKISPFSQTTLYKQHSFLIKIKFHLFFHLRTFVLCTYCTSTRTPKLRKPVILNYTINSSLYNALWFKIYFSIRKKKICTTKYITFNVLYVKFEKEKNVGFMEIWVKCRAHNWMYAYNVSMCCTVYVYACIIFIYFLYQINVFLYFFSLYIQQQYKRTEEEYFVSYIFKTWYIIVVLVVASYLVFIFYIFVFMCLFGVSVCV